MTGVQTCALPIWGTSTVLRAILAFIKTRGFGPFSQFYELLHTVLGSVDSFEGISGIYQNRGFGPFSQLYELLHTVLGSVAVSRAFLAIVKTRGFGPFSQWYELLHTVLGSVDSFEVISGIYPNSSIWSFLTVI